MQKLVAIFYRYALLTGLTSYTLVNGRFRQTRATKTYAWAVNLILLAALPHCLWTVSNLNASGPLIPRFIKMAPLVAHSVLYFVVLYTVALRWHRDGIMMELQKLMTQVDREMTRSGKKTNSKLRKLIWMKALVLVYNSLCNLASCFIYGSPMAFRLMPRIPSLINNIGVNVVMGNVFIYFLSIWYIARGYDFINDRIEDLISDLKPLSSSKKRELSRLWALHFRLGRTVKRINNLFGPQMLAARLNYYFYSVINGYFGLLLWTDDLTSLYFKLSWIIVYSSRNLGSFLTDYLIGLTTEFQSKRRDSITEQERSMPREIAAYIIYESSIKTKLTFCGLFCGNRSNWLQMMEVILSHFMLIMQFHMALGGKID